MTWPWIGLPVVGLVAGALAWLLWRSRAEAARLRAQLESASANLERLQRVFGRFAPHEIVEQVIDGGVTTSGERREVTVLFADLVGYTKLAESVDPSVLVRILNGYFERMSAAISGHRGRVSTLIGDGILAMFGAPDPNPWQANDAAHAALEMRAQLIDYNRELERDGLPPLSIGIGLHRGTGVAGLVGSRDLIQYAFVGRTINVAARVQDLTRGVDADILVTREVQSTLDSRFELRPFAPVEIRGLAAPVATWAVEGYRG